MVCIRNMGIYHSLEKNETATMIFLKKTSLVVIVLPRLIIDYVCGCQKYRRIITETLHNTNQA